MDETWKPVVGYEGWYEVSDAGRVKRVTKTTRGMPGRILKPYPDHCGYPTVVLCTHGKMMSKKIHMLVAIAFIGPYPEGKEVNHIDGDPGNACVSNLEYLTHTENMRHAKRLGLIRVGRAAKLTEEQVALIKGMLKVRSTTIAAICKVFKMSRRQISSIASGFAWGQITPAEPYRSDIPAVNDYSYSKKRVAIS